MPPKINYTLLPILVKTQRLTIFLEAGPKKSVAELKEDALSALTSKVINADGEEDVPEVQSLDDFELCREIKEKRVPTGKFEILDKKAKVKDVASAYEVLVIRFRQDGILQPAEYTTAPLQDDEPEPDPKGKRKAPPL